MAYQLPLRYVKVSDQVALCATRIVAIMSTDSHQAREIAKKEKQAKTLINASGRDATRTVIIMDNGSVVSSPYSVDTLLNKIEQSNSKQLSPRKANQTRRLKVYDVADQEPNPEVDTEYSEFSTDIEEGDENSG